MQNPAKGRPKPLRELKTPSSQPRLSASCGHTSLPPGLLEMRLYQQLLSQHREVHSKLPLVHICHFRLRCFRDVKTAGK